MEYIVLKYIKWKLHFNLKMEILNISFLILQYIFSDFATRNPLQFSIPAKPLKISMFSHLLGYLVSLS